MSLLRTLIERIKQPRCNICGGREFTPGPKGRLSARGKPPRCARCHSLERHRAFRSILVDLGPRRFRPLRCLQFSKDPTVDKRWFERFELTVFGKRNSLDLQQIDRPDGSYDAIICNHVLEHVADYRAALRELARVLSRRGFLFLSFPDPYRVEHTQDWGYPKPDLHNHYRHFGRDVEEVFGHEMPDCFVVAVTSQDQITGIGDMAYVVTRNPQWFKRARNLKLETRVCAAPRP
ncbi:class I SAM-dependent methyltransferase [Dongia deserti]|uniref:class I SAM-dependent methyltransferase n=1 Tax=Dongia deserti TaxID=2268030 RepID=UPI000E65C5CA|nr:class I SAM-dependent methyltransferase [Dongia deserti]